MVKLSLLPNLEILGIPIGDFVFCSRSISEKCTPLKALFKALFDVFAVDLHVAFSLLRLCGSYCKLVHLARAVPPSLCEDALRIFDEEVNHCFSSCIPDAHRQQEQLGHRFGGLGLRSLSLHSSAAFISSLASSGHGTDANIHLQHAITKFNAQVSPRT